MLILKSKMFHLKRLLFSIAVLFIFSLSGSKNLAAKSTPVASLRFVAQERVIYKNNSLYLQNFSGTGTVEIFTIIGKKVATFGLQGLNQAQFQVNLKSQNLYIVRVATAVGKIHTFKLLTP